MADEVHVEHTPAPAPVTAVVDAGSELTQPIVDHTEKITRLEEQQARMQEERFREMRELEERLLNATASQAQGLQERMAALEAKMEAAATETAEVPEAGVDVVLPEVEDSPAPPEKMKQGMRHRRKARRKGRS